MGGKTLGFHFHFSSMQDALFKMFHYCMYLLTTICMLFGSLGQTFARKTLEEVPLCWVKGPHVVRIAEFEVNLGKQDQKEIRSKFLPKARKKVWQPKVMGGESPHLVFE